MSDAGLTSAPAAPAWTGPRDRRALYGTMLRCALLLNVVGATSAFNSALIPSGLSSIQQYLGVICWILIIAAARGARAGVTTVFGSDTWALIVFYSFAVMSVLWTDMTMASVMKAVALTITTIGAFTLASRARLQDVIHDVNIGLLILNVASIVVVITMPTTGIAVGWGQEGSWQGIFESKQSLGVLGGMAIFFSGYLWLTRGASWLLAVSFICAVICTIGSGSRGGGAVALLSCVSVFLAGRSRNIAKLMAFAPLLIMGIGTAMISYLYVTGEDAFPFGDTRLDFTERTFIWQHALAHIDQSPLLGFGINGFWTNGDIYGAFKRDHGWVLDDFHSGFVSILTELGLIGYTIFAICTLLFALRMASAVDHGDMERSRIVALLGFVTLAYQIDVTETLFLRSTSFLATLILVFAFNATLRPAPEKVR